MSRFAVPLPLALFLFLPDLPAAPPSVVAPRISIVLSRTVQAEPFTGRVFVFFSKEPITGVARQNWFKPHPFFAQDVVKLAPEAAHAFKAEVDTLIPIN